MSTVGRLRQSRTRAGISCPACPATPGVSTDSARRPETMGNNRHQSGKPDTRTGRRTRGSDSPFRARRLREAAGQRPGSALKQLPRHDHAMDLVGALVDLGDRGLAVSFRRSTPCRGPWYQHGSSTGGSSRMMGRRRACQSPRTRKTVAVQSGGSPAASAFSSSSAGGTKSAV
jgi:hypothetical protein